MHRNRWQQNSTSRNMAENCRKETLLEKCSQRNWHAGSIHYLCQRNVTQTKKKLVKNYQHCQHLKNTLRTSKFVISLKYNEIEKSVQRRLNSMRRVIAKAISAKNGSKISLKRTVMTCKKKNTWKMICTQFWKA